jgi:hypothetical protein
MQQPSKVATYPPWNKRISKDLSLFSTTTPRTPPNSPSTIPSDFTYSSLSSSDDDLSTSDEQESEVGLLFHKMKIKHRSRTKSTLSQLLLTKTLLPQNELEAEVNSKDDEVEGAIPIFGKNSGTCGSLRIDRELQVNEGRFLVSFKRWEKSIRFRLNC